MDGWTTTRAEGGRERGRVFERKGDLGSKGAKTEMATYPEEMREARAPGSPHSSAPASASTRWSVSTAQLWSRPITHTGTPPAKRPGRPWEQGGRERKMWEGISCPPPTI